MAAKKDNLFHQAKCYVKKHPRTSFQEAIQIVSKKRKKAAVGRKPRKKATTAKKTVTVPAAGKKVKVKLKPGKKGAQTITIGKAKKKSGLRIRLGISGISLDKVKNELNHQQSLVRARDQHKAMLKDKGLKPAEKAQLRRDVKHYTHSIAASKRYVSQLKRSI
jgi:hypothetical protein